MLQVVTLHSDLNYLIDNLQEAEIAMANIMHKLDDLPLLVPVFSDLLQFRDGDDMETEGKHAANVAAAEDGQEDGNEHLDDEVKRTGGLNE